MDCRIVAPEQHFDPRFFFSFRIGCDLGKERVISKCIMYFAWPCLESQYDPQGVMGVGAHKTGMSGQRTYALSEEPEGPQTKISKVDGIKVDSCVHLQFNKQLLMNSENHRNNCRSDNIKVSL